MVFQQEFIYPNLDIWNYTCYTYAKARRLGMCGIFIGNSMFWNVGNGCDTWTDYGTYHVDNALFCGIGELQQILQRGKCRKKGRIEN